MHFGLAAQPVNRGHEGLAVGAYSAAHFFFIVENRAKPKWQHGSCAEALAYNSRVFQDSFLVEPTFGEFADDDGEFSAGVRKDLVLANSMQVRDEGWAS